MFANLLDTVRNTVAVLITASGVLSLALFIAWIRRRNFFLLYFGIGAAMYGVRLFLAPGPQAGGTAVPLITLVIPIPLGCFLSRTVAPTLRKTLRWICADQCFAGGRALAHCSLPVCAAT